MRRRWLSEKKEDINERVDHAAERLQPKRDAIKQVPDRDTRLTRAFPYFVAMCLVIWLCGFIYVGDFTFSKLVELLCLVFVVCFAILGVPCLIMMDRGVFNNWVLFGLAVFLSGLMWLSGIFQGEVYYANAVIGMLSAVGLHFNDIVEFVIGFGATLGLVYFTAIGVLSVISAYMRQYMSRVFLSMQNRAGTGCRGKAEGFFMVPDIIDVEEVILEPEEDPHTFHFSSAVSLWAYLFILGLLVSSYLFVNPLLIQELGQNTMLAVMLMLSMFTPALVLPWIIVRAVGAKVRSSAPRDYCLWIGARKRLFTTFMALGVFMMMFILSVYLGTDAASIVMNYVSFLIPLFATSAMYAGLYVNNFEKPVCDQICDRFEKGKRRDSQRDPRDPGSILERRK